MVASYKFLQKLWSLHKKISEKIRNNSSTNQKNLNFEKFINRMINKFNNNLDGFNYNVIIANIYEAYNFINREIESNIDSKSLRENYKKILILFSPAIPHFSSECLEDLGYNQEHYWPEVDKNLLEDNKIDYVVQINGKKRAILNESRDIDEDSLMKLIKSNKLSEKFLKGKSIDKIIFVKNRLINILLND